MKKSLSYCIVKHEKLHCYNRKVVERCVVTLTVIDGYIDANKVVVNENIAAWEGRKVVVTILDSTWNQNSSYSETSEADKKAAALEISGLWKDHENEMSVNETVRSMRKGRCFDI